MKISGSFISMLIIWLLGFTHFLGGPYILFKFIFWIALLPFFIAILFLIFMLFKAKKIFSNKGRSAFSRSTEENPSPFEGEQEAIHIEAEIKE
ncbi:MAG: hypothetical protein WCX46_02165 [Candidatus Paceibacterota bacterium]